jgi:hypothetical protein
VKTRPEFRAELEAYSERGGHWRTASDIGSRVYKGMTLGHLDGRAAGVPIDGMLRGVVRNDTWVPSGVKLLEVDPRGRAARWTGIDERGHCIALATIEAIATLARGRVAGGGLRLRHSTQGVRRWAPVVSHLSGWKG